MKTDLRHIDIEVDLYFGHIIADVQSYVRTVQLCVDEAVRDGHLGPDNHECLVTMLGALKDRADEAWLSTVRALLRDRPVAGAPT